MEGKKLTYKLCNSHHFSVSIKRYGVQVKEKSFTTPTSYQFKDYGTGLSTTVQYSILVTHNDTVGFNNKTFH